MKAKPFNVEHGISSGFLTTNNQALMLNMGTNIFVGGGTIIQADNNVLVALYQDDQGRVELTLNLYDKHDNQIFSIDKNEWKSGNPSPWDIQASYQKLKIRKHKGLIALEINLQQVPAYIKANLWWKGHLIFISPYTLRVDRNEMDCHFIDCRFDKCCLAFYTNPELRIGIIPNSEY